MAIFEYKGSNKKGKLVTGTISAKSEKEVEAFLEDKELKILSVRKEKKSIVSLGGGNFPLREKISLCRYLSLIINAGISLSEGLDMLSSSSDNKTVKRVLEDIASSTRRGTSLYESFSHYRQYFGEVFLTMIKTGETAGTLAGSLSYLSRQFAQEKELRSKVLSALLYPIIIISLMLVVGMVVFTFVLPRLAKVFMKLNLDFPLYTKILFAVSLFLEKNMLLLFGTIGVLVFIAVLLLRSKQGKNVMYWVMVRLPGIKKVILEYNLVRFTQSLSSLLKSGVTVTDAVELSVQSLSFVKT